MRSTNGAGRRGPSMISRRSPNIRLWYSGLVPIARHCSLVAFLFAAILYAHTLRGTFVYDDRDAVRDDPRVSEPGRWVEFFRQPYLRYAPDPLWRPLPCLSFVVQNRIHGDRAWPFHLVNVLLHGAASALVAAYARRLAMNYGALAEREANWIGLVAGLLFAAHPAHVEVVAGIVGRAESMCTLAIVGGLLLFETRPLRTIHVLGIITCFGLAVLSKEHGVLMAPMLGIIYWLGRKQRAADKRAIQLLFVALCFSLLAYIFVRESIMRIDYDAFCMRWTVNPVVRARGIHRMLVPISILGRYVGLLVAPLNLSPDYGAWVTNDVQRWNDPWLYVGLMAIVAWVGGIAAALRRKANVPLICLLCFGVAYFLISNFVFVIGTAMGERLIYLASVFFVIMLAWAIFKLPRGTGIGLVVVILVLYSIRTLTYAADWNAEHRLMTKSRARQPRSVYLHVLEARSWLERGEPRKADEVLAQARELCPESANVWQWSAIVAKALGKSEQEKNLYERRAFELSLNPPHMPPNAGRKKMNDPLKRPASRSAHQ